MILNFIGANAGTIFIVAILVCIVAAIVRKIIKDKGKCSGNCDCCGKSSCGGNSVDQRNLTHMKK